MEITIIVPGQALALENASLAKLLLKGNRLELHHQYSLEFLYNLFEVAHAETQNLPLAAISALTDIENSEGKTWMRVDPIFLHADLTSLLLFDGQNFSLTREEVMSLFSIINPMLEEDGLRLVCGDEPSRWYLQLEKEPLITTTAPGIVNGRDIRPFLPDGKDRAYWIRLGNELQMLLHDCLINQERQQRGEVPINSVWFWGVGKLTDQKGTRFDHVISNDVNARGLAIHAGIPHEVIPADFNHFLNTQEKGRKLLIVLSQGDLALSESEVQQEWPIFDLLLSDLKKGKIDQLEIISDDQHCLVKRSHLYRFWRREKS